MSRPQEAYLEYKQNPTKEKELQIVHEACKDMSPDAMVFWKCAFEAAPDVYLSLVHATDEYVCLKALEDVKQSERSIQPILLKQCAMTAYAQDNNWREACFTLGKEERYEELKETWINHFARYPEFQSQLEKQKSRFERINTFNVYKEEPKTAMIYTFKAPLQVFLNPHEEPLGGYPGAFIKQIISDLKRQPITLSQFIHPDFHHEDFYVEDENICFQFESTSFLTDHEVLKAETNLKSQLSDGWAENLQNKPKLIGRVELKYRFGEPVYVPVNIETPNLG